MKITQQKFMGSIIFSERSSWYIRFGNLYEIHDENGKQIIFQEQLNGIDSFDQIFQYTLNYATYMNRNSDHKKIIRAYLYFS